MHARSHENAPGHGRSALGRRDGGRPGDGEPGHPGRRRRPPGPARRGARAAGDRIGEIVASVREYSYLDRAPVGDVDVVAGIESTLVMLRSRLEAGIEVRRSYPAGRPRIEAFGSELNQVWTNLIVNAADAMGGRGVLEIAVQEDRVPGAERAPGVRVAICDSGPGIPDDVRARIFEPFFTTKDVGAGSGLGLHIVRSIVDRHAGRIDVASVPGRTCLTVTLPGRLPPDR